VQPAASLEHEPFTNDESALTAEPRNDGDAGTRSRTLVATPTVVACTLTAALVIAAVLLMKI
jgi:hypothetical protein